MQDYHYIWLSFHPERSKEWLKEKLADGFHVHHIDGNRGNNHETNLVLIDGNDHIMIHNGKKRPLFLLKGISKENCIRKRLWVSPCKKFYIKLFRGERRNVVSQHWEEGYYDSRKKCVSGLNDNEKKFYNIED